MKLTEENLIIGTYLTIVLSAVSLISCLFFVIFYVLTRSGQKFYLQLVVYLQIADSILAFGLLLSIFDVKNSVELCRFQAFIVQFGIMSSIIWRSSISIIMYISIKKGWEAAESQEIRLLIINFWLALLFSFLFFIL